jgi:lipoyl synthase
VRTDRGGDITYHGPGQLVGYPILSVPGKRGGGMADTVAYVTSVEQLVLDVLADLGLPDAGRLPGLPGVWVAPGSDRPRKIAAIGVRLSRGRTMHGFALNVDPDLTWFDRIVPCGITDKGVTSLRAEGLDVDLPAVVDAVVARAVERWGGAGWERADVVALPSHVPLRLGGLQIRERKPEWLRAPVRMGDDYQALRRRMRSLDLVTVCEEAGCPNIYECWSDGTATFMLNGERCTRACGFCLVDTSRPEPVDEGEPERVAAAVAAMGLQFAVLTAVARDDLPDGGAHGFARTVEAIRRRCPGTQVEVLIPDCKGDPHALDTIFATRPDVLNHNLETVARLQRAVRPSAGYARSLAVLARARAAGLTTKSGLILGLGETEQEVLGALGDLAAVGVEIVTIGQYLRPTAQHLPVARWWAPEEFDRLRDAGEALGIATVEAGPLVRSSYHARQAAEQQLTSAG